MFKELANKLTFFVRKSSGELSEIKRSGQGETGVLQTLLENETNETSETNETNEKTKKRLSAGDLCAKLCLTSGRMALALKSLEKKHLIIRYPDETDKRRTLVKLTEKGRLCAEITEKKINEAVNRIIEKLGEKNAAEFINMLASLAE